MLRGILFLSALVFPPFEEFSLHFLDAVFYNRCRFLDFVAFFVKLEFLRLYGVVWRESHVSEFLGAFFVPPLVEGLVNFLFLAEFLDDGVKAGLDVENPECCDRQKRHVMMEFEKPERF